MFSALLVAIVAMACSPPPSSSRPASAPVQASLPAPATYSPAQPPAASPPDPRVTDLDRRVAELEQRVRNLEQKGVASWSCQAKCGAYQNDNEHFSLLTATGESAAEAMDKLLARCSQVLYTRIQRTDEGSRIRIELVPPTIQDSCTRN